MMKETDPLVYVILEEDTDAKKQTMVNVFLVGILLLVALSCGGWYMIKGQQVNEIEATVGNGIVPPDSVYPANINNDIVTSETTDDAHYVTGPWSDCYVTCGGGEGGQWRDASCSTGMNEDCAHITWTIGLTSQPCNTQDCDAPVCTDGEEDNSEVCMPRICSGGEWQIMIIDCQEAMAPETCESGIFIPAEEGECCSYCSEGSDAVTSGSDGGSDSGSDSDYTSGSSDYGSDYTSGSSDYGSDYTSGSSDYGSYSTSGSPVFSSSGSDCFPTKLESKRYGDEIRWFVESIQPAGNVLTDCVGLQGYANGVTEGECCLLDGSYRLSCTDTYGDGWHGGALDLDDVLDFCLQFTSGRTRIEFFDVIQGRVVKPSVDGGFGTWSVCTATCDGGTQTRLCDSPAPVYGGADCVGVTSQVCGTTSCPRCTSTTIAVNSKSYGSEIRWRIKTHQEEDTDCTGENGYPSHSTRTKTCCLPDNKYHLWCEDTYGDGWHHGSISVGGVNYCSDFDSGRYHQQVFWLENGEVTSTEPTS